MVQLITAMFDLFVIAIQITFHIIVFIAKAIAWIIEFFTECSENKKAAISSQTDESVFNADGDSFIKSEPAPKTVKKTPPPPKLTTELFNSFEL